MPLNLVVRLPAELEPATERVSGALRQYLIDRGHSVSTLPLPEARRSWEAVIRDIEASGSEAKGFDVAAAEFARRIAEATSCDALILPALVYRTAKYVDPVRQGPRVGRWRWDGVMRHFWWASFTEFSAASLHVMIYSKSGEKVFEGYGGVDFAHERQGRGYVLSANPLDDPEHIAEGIAVALQPYLAD